MGLDSKSLLVLSFFVLYYAHSQTCQHEDAINVCNARSSTTDIELTFECTYIDSSCNIDCQTCGGSTITATAASVSITCGINGACQGSIINATGSGDVQLTCLYRATCREATFSCGTGDCVLQCGISNSCKDMILDSSTAHSFSCTGDGCNWLNFTSDPTSDPTMDPTMDPTSDPTTDPTTLPTPPSQAPTNTPTISPTDAPTYSPTNAPTRAPTFSPAPSTDQQNSIDPTNNPTTSPTTKAPTPSPSLEPTNQPTESTTNVLTATTTIASTDQQNTLSPTIPASTVPQAMSTTLMPAQSSSPATTSARTTAILACASVVFVVFCLCTAGICYYYKNQLKYERRVIENGEEPDSEQAREESPGNSDDANVPNVAHAVHVMRRETVELEFSQVLDVAHAIDNAHVEDTRGEDNLSLPAQESVLCEEEGINQNPERRQSLQAVEECANTNDTPYIR